MSIRFSATGQSAVLASALTDKSVLFADANGKITQDADRFTYTSGANKTFNLGSDGGVVFQLVRNETSINGPVYRAIKSRGTQAARTVVVSGDELGFYDFQGHDGTGFVSGAQIIAYVDGTPGTNDMPGRLVFTTTPDGSATPVERMRINSGGDVILGPGEGGTPSQGIFRGASAVGANVNGGHLFIKGGKGTGTGAGGVILFETSPAGGAGSSQNAYVERLRLFADTGHIGQNASSVNVVGWAAAYRIFSVKGESGGSGVFETQAGGNGDGSHAGVFDFITPQNDAGHREVAQISVFNSGPTANQRGAYMSFFAKADAGTTPERLRISGSTVATAGALEIIYANSRPTLKGLASADIEIRGHDSSSDLYLQFASGRHVIMGTSVQLKWSTEPILSRDAATGLSLEAAAGGAYLSLREMASPGTPDSTRARLYIKDNGAGKQQIAIKWDDGAESIIFTQP